MAIPNSEFNLQRVSDEFGTNTLGTSNSLKDFHTRIFGDGSPGKTLKGFANTGQPSISLVATQSPDEDTIVVSFDVNKQNVGITYYIGYSSQDSDHSGSTDDVTPTGDSAEETIGGLRDGETYSLTIFYWNGFNSHSSDYKTHTTTQKVQDSPQHPKPVVDDVILEMSDVHSPRFDLIPKFDYGTSPSNEDDWRMRHDVNQGFPDTTTSIYDSDNIGTTTNPKYLYGTHSDFEPTSIDEGDVVYVQIRAEASNGKDASSYSDTKSAVVRALTAIRIDDIQQRDDLDNDTRVRVWFDYGIYGDNTDFQLQWEVNGSVQHNDTLNGINSATRDFNEDDNVRVRARYVEGQDQSWSSWSDTVTVELGPDAPSIVSIFGSDDIVLDWASVDGATQYNYQIRVDGTIQKDTYTGHTNGDLENGCSYTSKDTPNASGRVRSYDGSRLSEWTSWVSTSLSCGDDDGGGGGDDPIFQ